MIKNKFCFTILKSSSIILLTRSIFFYLNMTLKLDLFCLITVMSFIFIFLTFNNKREMGRRHGIYKHNSTQHCNIFYLRLYIFPVQKLRRYRCPWKVKKLFYCHTTAAWQCKMDSTYQTNMLYTIFVKNIDMANNFAKQYETQKIWHIQNYKQ